MKQFINIFWYPDIKTVNGFKHGTYILLATALLLSFVLHKAIILGIFLVFFILRSIVSLRSAVTNDIDEEKTEKYSGENFSVKRAYTIFYAMITMIVIGIIFFYINTGGLFGLAVTILMATITLPRFFEEIVIIKRCQSEYGQ